MSVKPEVLIRVIEAADVLQHPVKAKNLNFCSSQNAKILCLTSWQYAINVTPKYINKLCIG